jgi:hypothetical protein
LGICRPILVNGDFAIVEGHGIREAAKGLGIAEVLCIVIDHLDAIELRLLRLALINRIAETGNGTMTRSKPSSKTSRRLVKTLFSPDSG